jgi:uncharacterized protein
VKRTHAARRATRLTSGAVVAAFLLGGCAANSATRRDLEVSFRNGDMTLAGTLSIPGGRKRPPVAVFVSGDGPQDRDANPGGANLFHVLADSLVAHGVAVLRHDDRGAGRSSRPSGPPSYRALLDDTRAAIAFVRARDDVDARRVFLVGHSEGAKTCEVLAAEDSSLAGIALLAGATVVNVDSLLEEQARLTPDGPAARLLSTLRRAQAGERARDATDLTDWMREHLEFDPGALLPRIHCPVLILQGEDDRLVRPRHAVDAAAAIERGGNRHVTLRTFPGLTHGFTPSAGGTGTAGTGAATTLAEWLAAQ